MGHGVTQSLISAAVKHGPGSLVPGWVTIPLGDEAMHYECVSKTNTLPFQEPTVATLQLMAEA